MDYHGARFHWMQLGAILMSSTAFSAAATTDRKAKQTLSASTERSKNPACDDSLLLTGRIVTGSREDALVRSGKLRRSGLFIGQQEQ